MQRPLLLLVASSGRRQVGDVPEISGASGCSLHADEVVQADDTYDDACGACLDGPSVPVGVVAGSWDIVEGDDRAGIGVEREAGTVGQRLGVGRVEVQQLGVDAAESRLQLGERGGQALEVVAVLSGDQVDVGRGRT